MGDQNQDPKEALNICYGDSGESTFDMPITTEEQEIVVQYALRRFIGFEPRVEFFAESNDELRYIAKRMTGKELSGLFDWLGKEDF